MCKALLARCVLFQNNFILTVPLMFASELPYAEGARQKNWAPHRLSWLRAKVRHMALEPTCLQSSSRVGERIQRPQGTG